jgi:hypothetical protein
VRISVGEVSTFEQAVAANEPFGLTVGVEAGSAALADLFLPILGPHPPHKVFEGLDSGMLAFECDLAVHGRLWALRAAPSGTADAAASQIANATFVPVDNWPGCAGKYSGSI